VSYRVLDDGKLSQEAFLPYASQWVDEDDIAAVVEVLRGSWLTQGPRIRDFEARAAEACGAKYAVAVATGTAALHCAAFAAGVGPGDEAITAAITFVASANCVAYLGARPVLADVDPETVCCDPADVERRITARTKAVIAVDFAGHPADMDALAALARRRGLALIEDAAHSLGARYHGRPVGTLADMTVLSFHPVKHITTGEGGMILTDREDLRDRLQLFRTNGITNQRQALERPDEGPWYYEMQVLGYNYRITDLQCALGLSQLAKLGSFVARRRAIAARYRAGFADVPEVIVPRERPGVESSYHLYPIQLDLERLRASRREVFEALRARNIGVQVHYIPVHLQPYYRQHFGHRPGDFPAAERYYARCISLPMYPRLGDADVDRVIAVVRELVTAGRA
jgi:UDP-4-amino-4,6-dideoxy-N-acetyl-beta-L-altrosamine transaminase